MQFVSRLLAISAAVAATTSSFAVLDLGTTDASDGDFIRGEGTHVLDMSLAATGTWDMPSPVPGRGVYDPIRWVVVYKFNNINLSAPYWARSTMTFLPHPSGCPVMVLAQGNCDMSYGQIYPHADGNANILVGGFLGGVPIAGRSQAGHGPGGGQVSLGQYGGGGSYGTQGSREIAPNTNGKTYGNEQIIPLIGGSGAASTNDTAGGRGGGAVLLAVRGNLTMYQSSITARGTSTYEHMSGGSGGAIRVLADTINGITGVTFGAEGASSVYGSYGGNGRIRIECNTNNATIQSNPPASFATPGPVAKLFPESFDPKVTISKINAVAVTQDPKGNILMAPDHVVTGTSPVTVEVEASNVPTGGTWVVEIRGAPESGLASTYQCAFATGNQAFSTWTATVPYFQGNTVLQVRARKL